MVPVDSSAPWTAITGRFHSLAAAYAHFDSLTGGPGIGNQGPVGAAPLGLADAQTLGVFALVYCLVGYAAGRVRELRAPEAPLSGLDFVIMNPPFHLGAAHRIRDLLDHDEQIEEESRATELGAQSAASTTP